ncbi:MAG: hypothetical protein ACF8QF_01125 [Phycisphaerales bacterium]
MSARRRRITLGALAVAVCAAGAIAFQERIVGGYALDANLAVESSGLNAPAWRMGTPGLERARYSIGSRTSRAGEPLGRPTYTTVTPNPSFVLGSGVGATVVTRDPRTGQTTFRADPLRVPQYDALRVRETIPTYGRSGVRPAGSPYRVAPPTAPVMRAPTTARARSGNAISNRAYSLRAPR